MSEPSCSVEGPSTQESKEQNNQLSSNSFFLSLLSPTLVAKLGFILMLISLSKTAKSLLKLKLWLLSHNAAGRD